MNKNKLATLYILTVLLSLPFYTSSVFAVDSLTATVAGADGIDNFAQRFDNLTFDVTAELSSDVNGISPNQVRVVKETGSVSIMDSCSLIAGQLHSCTLELFQSILDPTNYTVELLRDGGSVPVKEVELQVTPDFFPPRTVDFTIDPLRTRDGQVTLNYEVEDDGYILDTGENCVGLEKIVFKLDSMTGPNILPTPIFIAGTGNCSAGGSASYTSTASGDVTVCLLVSDLFAQTNILDTTGSCKTFEVDTAAPTPTSSSLDIEDDQGNSINFIGNTRTLATVSIEIDATDVDPAAVSADFSDLTDDIIYANINPSVPATNNRYFWNGVPLEKVEPNCMIRFSVADDLGNFAVTPVPCGVVADVTGPEVTAMFTPFTNTNGDFLLPAGTTKLSATIREAGVGLTKEDIRLDLSNLNLGNSVPADNCTNTTLVTWQCEWDVTISQNFQSQETTVTVLSSSTDLLNNPMGGPFDFDITVDTTEPTASFTGFAAFSPNNRRDDLILAGDTVEYFFQADGFTSAKADFEDLGAGIIDAVCEDAIPGDSSSTLQNCTFSAVVVNSGPYDATVEFMFADDAGNLATGVELTKELEVLGLFTDVDPNFWRVDAIECSPEVIDRGVTALLEQRVYCKIDLTQTVNPNAEILSTEMGDLPDCTGDTDALRNVRLINTAAGSQQPFFEITLAPREFLVDNVTFACPITIGTKLENEFVEHPETETVDAVLHFYNNPQGLPDERLVNKINDVREDTDDAYEFISEVNRVFTYGEQICQIKQMMSNTASTLTVLMAIFAADWTKVTDNVYTLTCEADSEMMKGLKELDRTYFQPVCNFINCRWSDEAKEQLENTDGLYAGGMNILSYGSGAQTFAPGIGGESLTELSPDFDVKQSLVWSTLSLCIPGIVRNVDKLRQIECGYGTCLIQETASGVPMSSCDEIRAFQECKFVYGEIFNLVPMLQVFSTYMNRIQGYLSDPIAAAGYLMNLFLKWLEWCEDGATCKETDQGKKTFKAGCMALAAVNAVGSSINDFQRADKMSDIMDSIGQTQCDNFEDLYDEWKEKTPTDIESLSQQLSNS